ncbi:hypothetical protein HRbin25_00583 [bacterium HR25]|jgi:RNA polymerase sigma-70 factor (ECF subfamily)|nr:hypothetical protein HRbin25_00583 [bacterium HR25]
MVYYKDPGEELHRRLLAADPTAPSEVFHHFHGPLTRRLRARFPQADEDTVHDAVVEAIMSYVKNPSRFDPGRSSLLTYLTMVARGDLLNALAKEARRQRRLVSLESVAQGGQPGNIMVDAPGDGPEGSLEASRSLRYLLEHLPDPTDRQVLGLMLRGERRTEPYARVLGLGDLSLPQQRAAVKRHKDRLKKRMRRLLERLDGAKDAP